MKVVITGQDLTLEQIEAVARNKEKLELSEAAKESVQRSRRVVDTIIKEKRVVYGVTTGFGSFCNTVIPTEESKILQKNLIITHAVGAGNPLPTEISRAVMLLRINNLAKGFSGIRMETLETLIAMLNKGVSPIIPEKGSLGASGDLAPLSHMVLPMIGLG